MQAWLACASQSLQVDRHTSKGRAFEVADPGMAVLPSETSERAGWRTIGDMR
jgi:hypothetical protein